MSPLTLAVDQHVYGFEGRTAEVIFIAGFAALVLVAVLVMKISFKHWLLAGMLFATALTAPTDELQTRYLDTWMLPVQLQRATIHLCVGVLLTLIMLMEGGVSAQVIPSASVILGAIVVLAGMLKFVHEDASNALQSLGFAMATIPATIAVVGRLSRDYEGCLKLIRVFMWVSVIWTFCCSVQFVINPQLLVNNTGRFWGMLGNAQQAALFCAPMAVAALWLLLNDPQKRTRVMWLALTAINLLFIIWTGSRMGALMLAVGLLAVLSARPERALILLPVAGLVFWALYGLSDSLQIGANLERFTSTDDTRGGVWQAQIRTALENPLVGAGWKDAGGSESSYLGGFAGYGFGMFLLMLTLVGVTMWGCLKLFTVRRRMTPELRALVDLYNAFMLMFFVGAGFEGFILARSATTSVMFLMFAGIGKFLQGEAAALDEWHPQAIPEHRSGGQGDGAHGEYGEAEPGN